MPTSMLGPYLYLGAFLTAVLVHDYVGIPEPFRSALAVMVFGLECYIAHRIVKNQSELERRPER